MTLHSIGKRFGAYLIVGILGLGIGSLSIAQVNVVNMNFDGPTGLENTGVGPDGVLVGNALITAGVGVGGTAGLVTDGSEPIGVDLDIGTFGTFSGAGNFSLSFDFKANTPGAESGQLFSAEGVTFLDAMGLDFPGDQEASISIAHFGDEVGIDIWFFDGGQIFGPFNDGNFHTVSLDYDANAKILTLSSPSAVEPAEFFFDGEPFPFANDGRDTTNDVTRLGDISNPDLSLDETGVPCDCTFDNLTIDGPAPPPVKLIVDRTTGGMSVEVLDAIDIDSLTVFSTAGTLISENYLGIANRLDNGPMGDGSVDPDDQWQIDISDVFEITESDIPGDGADNGATLTVPQMIDLGDGVWNPFWREEVRIAVNDLVLGASVGGLVEFVNGDPLLFGDISSDGVNNVTDGLIDEFDWIKFQSGFGTDVSDLSFFDAYFLADLTGDGFHNFEDYIAFVEAFDAVNGDGAFAAMVPEPGTCLLVLLGLVGFLKLRRHKAATTLAVALLTVTVILGSGPATADVLASYSFTNGFMDDSGNGRDAIPDAVFTPPTVMNGEAVFSGDFENSLIVPLLGAYPFDGTRDWTVELKFNTMGNTSIPGGEDFGVILFGAFNSTDFLEPNYEGLSMYVNIDGELVVDYFFIGGVIASTGESLLDGTQHSMIATYVAPDDPGDPTEPNPGRAFINLDGVWYGGEELSPRQFDGTNPEPCEPGVDCPPDQTATDFETRLGTTSGFPLIDEALEFQGTMDDVVIRNNHVAPTEFRAEVDLTTGDVSLLGGEFARDIKYYEINSEGQSLNPDGWFSLDEQNLDPAGTGPLDTWDELNDAPGQLAEGRVFGSSEFSDTVNPNVSLGNAFTPLSPQDLEIIAITTDLGDIYLEVEYVNAPTANGGDFDGNGLYECIDVNGLVRAIVDVKNGAAADLFFDLTGDGDVTDADLTQWLAEAGAGTDAPGLTASGNPVQLGDATLDGTVDGLDFIEWNDNKFTTTPLWCAGDFNADGFVDGLDFIVWNDNKFTSADGPAPVPEPAAGLMLLTVLCCALGARPVRQS